MQYVWPYLLLIHNVHSSYQLALRIGATRLLVHSLLHLHTALKLHLLYHIYTAVSVYYVPRNGLFLPQ